MPRFCVEVSVIRVDKANVAYVKREPAKSWIDAQALATLMASQMFQEDPRSSRSFQNGVMVYKNKNDLGDDVIIRPVVTEGSNDV